MDYNDLFQMFLNINSQSSPKGYVPIRELSNNTAHWLKPEDIASVLNAFSPYDLFRKPDTNFIRPSTVGITMSDVLSNPNMLSAILLSSQNAQSPILNSLEGPKNYFRYPHLAQAGPMAPNILYQHEVGHALDPRIFHGLNKGFLVKNRFSQSVPYQTSENPAWDREYN